MAAMSDYILRFMVPFLFWVHRPGVPGSAAARLVRGLKPTVGFADPAQARVIGAHGRVRRN